MKPRCNTCVRVVGSTMMILLWPLLSVGQSPANVAPAAASHGAAPQAVADISAITGEWQGVLGGQRLAFKIENSPDGLKATLILSAQGVTVPADTVSWQDRALHIGLMHASANFDGKLSADGSEIRGIWQEGGASPVLVLHRPGASGTLTLSPRTLGRVSLTPCLNSDGNIEGLCGKYEVYENRQTQTGRRIALNIMVLPSEAAKPEPDPFFALAGGPGQSATEAFPLTGYVARIRALRDVVMVDQRGTGQSNPLQCALQAPDDAQAVLGEPYSLDKIHECRAESEKKADPAQYTTSIAADDLDAVRQALGYDKINIFGGSYGTKAALVYLRRHGEHVRTVSLEAVASPQYLIPLPFAKAIQSSVDGVIARCAADAVCRQNYPDLRQEFNTLLERLEKSPARFEIRKQQVVLSHEMFVSKLRSLLYVPQFVSLFPFMVHNAFENDWSIYGNMVMVMSGQLEKVVARGASFAAICAEDAPGLTDAAIKRETEGTYLGNSQARRYQEYCRAWGPAGAIPKDFYDPVRSQVPALLIAGALDPATPPETAEQAARYLSKSRVVAIKEGTHGTGSPCIDGLIAEFVKQASSAGLDASCADGIHLPAFVPKPPGK